MEKPLVRGWDTPPRTGACARCARALAPLEVFWARLTARKLSLERTDFCETCWASEPKDPTALHWRTRLPEPKVKRELFDANELFEILKRLLEAADPDKARLCYLLALYCTRKRLLRLKGIEREEGRERLVFTTPRTRREYRVPSVDMGPEEMAAARDELGRLAAGSPA